jgi:hypothetical protein
MNTYLNTESKGEFQMTFLEYLSEKTVELEGKSYSSIRAAILAQKNIDADDERPVEMLAKKLGTSVKTVRGILSGKGNTKFEKIMMNGLASEQSPARLREMLRKKTGVDTRFRGADLTVGAKVVLSKALSKDGDYRVRDLITAIEKSKKSDTSDKKAPKKSLPPLRAPYDATEEENKAWRAKHFPKNDKKE